MIQVKNLTKRYAEHIAVQDLSFSIEKGQVYGFLGPNGAGKSTTMNIITGCLAPSQGQVQIGGFDIFTQPGKAKALIGYLPEQPPVYPDRTPREYLVFVARAKGIGKKQLGKEIARVMKLTGITHVADRLIGHLSKGYRQRVGIAQALLGDPEIIILDEPTVGLDPLQIVEIRELIRLLGKDHTVILSSHILSEIQAVCDTVMIISQGKLLACDTPENLEAQYAKTATLTLTVEASIAQAEQLLAGTDACIVTSENRCTAQIQVPNGQEDDLCRRLFHACAQAGTPILSMNVQKLTLEDIFLKLTRKAEL